MIELILALLMFSDRNTDWESKEVCFFQAAEHVTSRTDEEVANSPLREVVRIAASAYNERAVPYTGYYVGYQGTRFRYAEYCFSSYITELISTESVFIVEITEAQFLADARFRLPRYPE